MNHRAGWTNGDLVLVDARRLAAPVERAIDSPARCLATERREQSSYFNSLLPGKTLSKIKAPRRMRPNVGLDRDQDTHASSAKAGRSRECQPEWAGPRVVHQERRW